MAQVVRSHRGQHARTLVAAKLRHCLHFLAAHAVATVVLLEAARLAADLAHALHVSVPAMGP